MPRWSVVSVIVASLVAASACGGQGFVKRYEYEEDMYLRVDGSATVYVNASVPALVALRGADLDLRPTARLDRAAVREFFSGPGVRVARVTDTRRDGRRFAHVRLEVDDVRRLAAIKPFGWSTYRFERGDQMITYVQIVGKPTGRDAGDVGWSGRELTAFRLHLPSRIVYHDAPSKRTERGNIVEWEQSLNDRRAGALVHVEARMEPQSILYRTLFLFASMVGLALACLATVILWIARKGRQAAAAA